MDQFRIHKSISVPFASATTFNSYVGVAGARRIALEVPATALTYNFYCLVAHSSTDTFRRLTLDGVYSGGSGIMNWEVPQNTGNMMAIVPCEGFNYVRFEALPGAVASGVTNGLATKVHLMI